MTLLLYILILIGIAYYIIKSDGEDCQDNDNLHAEYWEFYEHFD